MKELERILVIQIFFLSCIVLGSLSGSMDAAANHKYLILVIAGFVAHLLGSQMFELACIAIGNTLKTKKMPELKLKNKYKLSLYVLVLAMTFLVYYGHSILKEEFLMLWMACASVRYLELKRQPATITYGEALACSFAEGYLFQVIPPGGEWVSHSCFLHVRLGYEGIVQAIQVAEASRRVPFPLRRMLVVFPRSLHCPRNLEAFNNKHDMRQPRLEQCLSLPDVRRDVAGVCDRVYRNTVYKIRRHATDPRPVHVVCATPINTLWMVLQKRAVYTPMAAADEEEIAAAFCATLPAIIHNSPELRDKCDLVYYDDTKPNANLAETLLEKIQEIESGYENISRTHQ